MTSRSQYYARIPQRRDRKQNGSIEVRCPCTSTQSIFKGARWIMRRKRWHHFGRSRNPSVRNCKAVCRITAGRLLDPPKPYLRFFQIIDAHRCRGCHRRSVLWPASSDSSCFGDGLGVSTCASCGVAGEMPLWPVTRGCGGAGARFRLGGHGGLDSNWPTPEHR